MGRWSIFRASSISAEISPSSLSMEVTQKSSPTVAALVCCSLATHLRSHSVCHQLVFPHSTMNGIPCQTFTASDYKSGRFTWHHRHSGQADV